MAITGASNFLLGDLLTELKLKPWWETWRGYGFSITVAAALAISYFVQTGLDLTCLPDSNSTEVQDNFTETEANFVNDYCFNLATSVDMFIGLIALGVCAFNAVATSWWLYVPSVIDRLRSYVIIRTGIEELNMTAEQLKTLSISQKTGISDKLFKVRDACSRLWNYNTDANRRTKGWSTGIDLRNVYLFRNCALLFTLSIVNYGVGLVIYFFVDIVNPFFSIDSPDDKILSCTIPVGQFEITTTGDYACVKKFSTIMFRLLALFVFETAIEIGFILFGTVMTLQIERYHVKPNCATAVKNWSKTVNNLKFINTLWTNSQSRKPGVFEQFCDFIGNHAEKRIRNQFLQNPESTDLYLIEVFTKLSSDWRIIAGMIYQQVTRTEFKCESEDHKNLFDIVHSIPELKWCKEVEVLLDYVYDERYFELFVSLLDIRAFGEDDDHIKVYLMARKIDTNAISKPYEQGRSILYYALKRSDDGTTKSIARKRIFDSGVGIKAAYVHYEGNSVRAKTFAKFEKLETRVWDNSTPGHGDTNNQFEKRVRELDHQEHMASSDIAQEISHYKFMTWSEEIERLAEKICQQKQWEVLVALINAFIVDEDLVKEETVDRVIPVCKLDLSEAVSPSREAEDSELPNSLLYFAFTKRDYAPFTLTAAATILHLTRGLEKKVRSRSDSELFYEDPIDFIMRGSNVPLHQKLELQTLVKAATAAYLPLAASTTPAAPARPTAEMPLAENTMV